MNFIQPSKLLSYYQIPHIIGGCDLNFKLNQGEEAYAKSVASLLERLDIFPQQLHHGEQVHGKHVHVSEILERESKKFAGYPLSAKTDGFITSEKGVALLVRMADCTPIALYDPFNHALGLVHSGWRSTVLKIAQEAIQKMETKFGSKASNMVAYIGPTIDQHHYEVGSEVYEAFAELGNRERYFLPQGEKYVLDMAQANIEVLLQAGIKRNNIECANISTFTSEELHSARREGENYQLNALLVYLP